MYYYVEVSRESHTFLLNIVSSDKCGSSSRQSIFTESTHNHFNMPSKLDYLSKYTSDPSSKHDKKKKKKHKKKGKKSGDDNNAAHVYDDDNEAVLEQRRSSEEDDDNEEDRPLVVASEDLPMDQRGAGVSHAPRGTWETTTADANNDATAPRRRYDSDASSSASASPRQERRKRRHDSDDEDNSSVDDRRPRRRRHDSSDDESDNDRNIKQENRSPSSRRRHDSDSDADSEGDSRRKRQRRRYDSSSDDNEKKPIIKEEDGQPRRRRRVDSDSDDSSRERMASGHKAGLQHYSDFTSAESKLQKQKHEEAQKMVDKYGMGETVYRDAQGKATDNQSKTAKVLSEEEQQALNMGRVQREREQAQAEELQRLSESAFARHRDDDQLDAALKDEIRKDDPMAKYAMKKQASKRKAAGLDDRPVYKGPPPKPNRFGIRPGYRWDGVDRGNGWEDKLLAKQYSNSQRKEQAYKWSSADM
jgi:pre-mRNA-splicing factor CWC26